ncbi:MAG: transcription antitermination factor NusB [Clostridia bacterium]|nr:transcription antitermination factor NusB [Clostridia bacterium]
MKKRHESREQAFVLLFEKSVSGEKMEDIIEAAVEARCIEMDPYCEKLTSLAELYLEEIDAVISAHIRGWSLRRLSKVALSILRLAVCEMKFLSAKDVPISVSINEAVELAKVYGNEKDASYINGVLSSVAKSMNEADNA